MYKELLKTFKSMGSDSDIETLLVAKFASESMRQTNYPIDSSAMKQFVETFIGIPGKFTELLWSLTETDLRITYTGIMPAGYPIKLSIPIRSEFEELKKFDILVQEFIKVEKLEIREFTD